MKYPAGFSALSLVAAGLFLATEGPRVQAGEAPPAEASSGRLIPARDARFRYEGRIDFSDPSAPVVIWQGSRISLDFDGAQVALRFAGGTGQNFFNAEMDGVNTIVEMRDAAPHRIELPLAGPGRHHLVLFKRNEASAGYVRFLGVEIAPGAQAWAPPAPACRLRMEFFGDSIMAGACNEDGDTDQWEDRRTHNNALSYTTLTAAAFAADYRSLAVSGMGIATGWTEVRAGQVWDRIYPVPGGPRADLKSWQPDVALLNLGENDDSFTRKHEQPFPNGYTAGYVALVKAFRAAYPQTQIVLLRGGMYGGAQSAPLREAWEAAVREIESGDKAVSHFVFTHWSSNHPRVSDDRALADELVAWLKAQPFMRRY